MYIRDNKESETEFLELKESNDKLQKELKKKCQCPGYLLPITYFA